MRSGRIARWIAILAVALPVGGSVHRVQAQRLPRGPAPMQAVSSGLALVRFAPDDPDVVSDFRIDGVAPTVSYHRPGLAISVLRATDQGRGSNPNTDLELLDLSLVFYGDLRVLGETGGRFRPFVPIGMTTMYRRVDATEGTSTVTLFEYQSLGLLAGIGARGGGRKMRFESRATPTIGFATRSLGNSTGFVYGVDAGAWLHFGPVMGRVGLSVGYTFGWKQWRVGGAEVAGRGRYRYTGTDHAFRLGVSW